MQSLSFSPQVIEAIYRFAFLLSGNPAAGSQAVRDAMHDSAGQAAQLRSDRHRNAWLVMKVREHCLRSTGEDHEAVTVERAAMSEQAALGASFHTLPEPRRSALALFYLDLFPSSEIADLLRMKPAQLAEALSSGRDLLRSQVGISQRRAASPAES